MPTLTIFFSIGSFMTSQNLVYLTEMISRPWNIFLDRKFCMQVLKQFHQGARGKNAFFLSLTGVNGLLNGYTQLLWWALGNGVNGKSIPAWFLPILVLISDVISFIVFHIRHLCLGRLPSASSMDGLVRWGSESGILWAVDSIIVLLNEWRGECRVYPDKIDE